jgi:hypothetical protein
MLCGSGLARRHQQTAAQLHAAGDEQEDHQHRGSVGHCRQRIGIQPQADDHGVGHGVKLCCHHAQDNGQRVPQQRGPYCPGQQRILFVHTNTLFSQKENPQGTCRPGPLRVLFQLRQQESNLRWGSQSPLPYRLAMAHR